jgi:kynureninase
MDSLPISRHACEATDDADPLAHARGRFILPEGVIYLDGNSLGALPASVPRRISDVIVREWGSDLVRSWNTNAWITLPVRIGRQIASLIGAEADEVIVADSTSVNLFKLAAAAMRDRSPRGVVLSEQGNFPTDLYVLQGLEELLGGKIVLRLVNRDEIVGAMSDEVALVVLTHVHYKTGELHDMQAVTKAAHDCGALMLWDLSHSAGVMDLFLDRDEVDLAIGCGYKYLNGGPGAPAFLYVARRHQERLRQPLSGWMGHAAPFDFLDRYTPASGIARYLCGTPTVLSMAALAEGIATFDGIAMPAVRDKSRRLGDLFLRLVAERCAGAGFAIACPTDAGRRGSQVALRHPDGYQIAQALIARGVIGDFRAPDVLRFGFAPLYARYVDVWDAVDRLSAIMSDGSWRDERYRIRAAVT